MNNSDSVAKPTELSDNQADLCARFIAIYDLDRCPGCGLNILQHSYPARLLQPVQPVPCECGDEEYLHWPESQDKYKLRRCSALGCDCEMYAPVTAAEEVTLPALEELMTSLEAAGSVASQGKWRSPWKPGSKQLCAGVEAVGSHYIVLHVDKDKDYHPDTVEMWKRDCDYIATASPENIRKLIHAHKLALTEIAALKRGKV